MKQFHLNPTFGPLLAAVQAAYDDDTARLVSADCLEEEGVPHWPALIRSQCKHAWLDPVVEAALCGCMEATLKPDWLIGRIAFMRGFPDLIAPINFDMLDFEHSVEIGLYWGTVRYIDLAGLVNYGITRSPTVVYLLRSGVPEGLWVQLTLDEDVDRVNFPSFATMMQRLSDAALNWTRMCASAYMDRGWLSASPTFALTHGALVDEEARPVHEADHVSSADQGGAQQRDSGWHSPP